MKSYPRAVVLLFLLAAACNLIFLIPNAYRAVVASWLAHGKTNAERRVLQKGNWYRAVLQAEGQLPFNASVRLVSPDYPWYLAYYFYPRLLLTGSESLADRQKVRHQYPQDWVLVYSESVPPEMTVYPPLSGKPAHG